MRCIHGAGAERQFGRRRSLGASLDRGTYPPVAIDLLLVGILADTPLSISLPLDLGGLHGEQDEQ
jgi:hypothetical protein